MANITPDFYKADGALPSPLVASEGTVIFDRSRIVPTVNGSPTTIVSMPTSISDGYFEASLNHNGAAGSAIGLNLRYTDNDNLIWVNMNTASDIVLIDRIAGSNTAVESQSVREASINQTHTVGAVLLGSDVHVFFDGDYVYSATTSVGASTNHGVRLGGSDQVAAESYCGYFTAQDTYIKLKNTNYESYQHSGGSKTVTVEGWHSGLTGAIEYSVDGGATWLTGVASPTGNNFSFNVSLDVGQYSLSVRDASATSVSDSKVGITVGDAWLIIAQSNVGRLYNAQSFGVNASGIEPTVLRNSNSFSRNNGAMNSNDATKYAILDDPNTTGSWFTLLAYEYQRETNIPVILVPCAQGSTEISEFQKTNTDRLDGLNKYECIAPKLAITGGASRCLFQLGESDSGRSTTRSTYESLLNQLINDIKADFGLDTYIIQLHDIAIYEYGGNFGTGASDTGQAAIRAGQINVAATNANAEISPATTSIDLTKGDKIHFIHDSEAKALVDIVLPDFKSKFFSDSVSITATGAPDGTYKTMLFDGETAVYSGNVTYTSGAATVSNILTGSAVNLEGMVIDNENPHVNGAVITGVTV